MQYKISVLIPSRNEEFLSKTVEDILKNTGDDLEIIVVLDGEWASPGLPSNKRLTIVYLPESIGQRASTNLACKLSKAKYIIKTDAHVSIDKDFDKKMLEAFEKSGDNVTMAPIMKNLHCFNLVCPDGHSRYQSPNGPCLHKIGEKNGKDILCGKETKKDIVWIAKKSPQSVSYCFDAEPHFLYFKDYAKRPEYKKDLEETGLTETMSLQGSFFMLTREKYWELNVCDDEVFGSWGSMGIEVSMKTWLSGGRVLVNHNTWYAHLFRTQGGDFGFPYPQSGKQVQNAKKAAKDLFFNNKWEKQIYPLSWVLDKFWPVQGWTEKDLAEQKEREKNHPKFGVKTEPVPAPLPKSAMDIKKGIIYYTCNTAPIRIAKACQNQLRKISQEKNIPIVSCSLKPMPDFGKNICLPLKRGVLTMFRQILTALEASDADVVYHCEHDVIYSPSHFDFIPSLKDKFYYNQNFWKVRLTDGFAVHFDANQVSGLCGYREHLINYYKERIKEIERDGFNRSYEPGRRDSSLYETYKSEQPNIDIRHKGSLSGNKWSLKDFRDKSTCINWQEGTVNDLWGKDILTKLIQK